MLTASGTYSLEKYHFFQFNMLFSEEYSFISFSFAKKLTQAATDMTKNTQ